MFEDGSGLVGPGTSGLLEGGNIKQSTLRLLQLRSTLVEAGIVVGCVSLGRTIVAVGGRPRRKLGVSGGRRSHQLGTAGAQQANHQLTYNEYQRCDTALEIVGIPDSNLAT